MLGCCCARARAKEALWQTGQLHVGCGSSLSEGGGEVSRELMLLVGPPESVGVEGFAWLGVEIPDLGARENGSMDK